MTFSSAPPLESVWSQLGQPPQPVHIITASPHLSTTVNIMYNIYITYIDNYFVDHLLNTHHCAQGSPYSVFHSYDFVQHRCCNKSEFDYKFTVCNCVKGVVSTLSTV